MRCGWLGGLLMLLALAQGALAGSAQIVLRQDATVSSGYVRLGEVADIAGERAEQLAQVFLGPAAELGQTKQISREHVLRCLRARGLEAGVELAGTTEVKVTTVEAPAVTAAPAAPSAMPAVAPANTDAVAAVRPAEAEDAPTQSEEATNVAGGTPAGSVAIRNAINQQRELAKSLQVRQVINQAATAYLVKALSIRNPSTVDVATDITRCEGLRADIAAAEIDAVRGGSLPGRCSVNLILKDQSGQKVGDAVADLQVSLTVTVPVLVRTLKQNEDVRPGDVVLRKVRYKDGMPVNPSDPADFVNMAADGTLRAGMAVRTGDFCPSLDVRKGEAISVIAEHAGFKITEQAIAGADGRRGDTISVTGLLNQNNYRVRITGPKTAEPPIAASAGR